MSIDPRREPFGLPGPEQVPVVLQGGAAAGRVDQDGRRPREGAHDPPGQPGGVGSQPGVHVEGAAAGRPGSGQGDPGAAGAEHGDGRPVNVPLPGVHHAAR